MRNLLIITIVLIVGFQVQGQSSIHNLIQKQTDEIFDSLVKIRRDFHMNPELSEHEKRSAEKIESYLRSLGLNVKTNIGGYGVVGILTGEKNGKHIAWRADIDAFKSDIPDVVEFESQVQGIRHICGHDVHTTIGLGIANILSKHKDEINGTIYFIFQPSEENFQGARSMIDDGLFEIIDPSEIYALHMNPLPVGLITTKENELYSYGRELSIKFLNIPNKDSVINYVKKRIMEYNTVDNRFWDNRNLGNPQIGINSPQSIYRNYLAIYEQFKIKRENDKLEISVGLFGTNINEIDSLPIKLKGIINESKYANNLESVEYNIAYPTVKNNPGLTQESINIITSVYGQNSFVTSYGVVNGFNDDFSYFQQEVPGVYFGLGGSNYEKGIISMPHSPNFAVDEECIKIGVKYFSSLIVERLKNE